MKKNKDYDLKYINKQVKRHSIFYNIFWVLMMLQVCFVVYGLCVEDSEVVLWAGVGMTFAGICLIYTNQDWNFWCTKQFIVRMSARMFLGLQKSEFKRRQRK